MVPNSCLTKRPLSCLKKRGKKGKRQGEGRRERERGRGGEAVERSLLIRTGSSLVADHGCLYFSYYAHNSQENGMPRI